jgi:hypothetical protein
MGPYTKSPYKTFFCLLDKARQKIIVWTFCMDLKFKMKFKSIQNLQRCPYKSSDPSNPASWRWNNSRSRMVESAVEVDRGEEGRRCLGRLGWEERGKGCVHLHLHFAGAGLQVLILQVLWSTCNFLLYINVCYTSLNDINEYPHHYLAILHPKVPILEKP